MSAPARARLVAVRSQKFERRIVVDGKAVPSFDHDAAVAMAGVLTEADVGDKDELFGCGGLFERAQALLHNAVFVPRAGCLFILCIREAKEQQAADAELRCLFGFAQRFVDGEIEDSRHGTDALRTPLPGRRNKG